jgi:hypothetical protein
VDPHDPARLFCATAGLTSSAVGFSWAEPALDEEVDAIACLAA